MMKTHNLLLAPAGPTRVRIRPHHDNFPVEAMRDYGTKCDVVCAGVYSTHPVYYDRLFGTKSRLLPVASRKLQVASYDLEASFPVSESTNASILIATDCK